MNKRIIDREHPKFGVLFDKTDDDEKKIKQKN